MLGFSADSASGNGMDRSFTSAKSIAFIGLP